MFIIDWNRRFFETLHYVVKAAQMVFVVGLVTCFEYNSYRYIFEILADTSGILKSFQIPLIFLKIGGKVNHMRYTFSNYLHHFLFDILYFAMAYYFLISFDIFCL